MVRYVALSIVVLTTIVFFVVAAVTVAWSDVTDPELQAAIDGNLWVGYSDGTFRPHEPLLKRHVAKVAHRAGMDSPDWTEDYRPATRADVRDAMPGLVWLEERWAEGLTRSQLARLVYRGTCERGAILDRWFREEGSRLNGHGAAFIRLSSEYDVPLWLALGQCWRESQFFTTGLSRMYECGWGIKDAGGKWGRLGCPATVSGYSNYATTREAIEAYFRLMGIGYRGYIDCGDWQGLLNSYAPATDDNNTQEHWRIVRTVRGWCEQRGL